MTVLAESNLVRYAFTWENSDVLLGWDNERNKWVPTTDINDVFTVSGVQFAIDVARENQLEVVEMYIRISRV